MVVKKIKQGSVLLYAVLVIALILSGTLLFGEQIRNSLRSFANYVEKQQALALAESGLERAFFEIRKNDEIPENENCFGISGCSWIFSDDDLPELFLNLNQNQTVQLELFSSDGLLSLGTESLRFSWEGDAWLELSFYRFESGNFSPWEWQEGDNWDSLAVYKMLLFGGEEVVNYPQANESYLLRIKALKGDVQNLKVENFNADNAQGDRLSFPNILKIQVRAKVKNSSAQLTAVMKRFRSAHGLFDFVIFSKDSLVK